MRSAVVLPPKEWVEKASRFNEPSCDSSGTYMRAVRLLPSPAVLLPGFAAGVAEVSRFSCMKFLDVSGVFDYAGLNRNSR
jgi:hypothetical protein